MDNLIVYKSPFQKIRIGNTGDGGYVITDLPGDYDALISGGIADDISFEQEFLDKYTHTQCIAFDGTINALPIPDPRITFIRKNLGGKSSQYITNLDDYLDSFENVFLKLDIEGSEFSLIPSLLGENIKKVKQLVIEVHTPTNGGQFNDFCIEVGEKSGNVLFNLLAQINTTHTLVHVHGNNGGPYFIRDGVNIPLLLECTFIRNDFVDMREKNTVPFPTELDYKNVLRNTVDHLLKGYPYSE